MDDEDSPEVLKYRVKQLEQGLEKFEEWSETHTTMMQTIHATIMKKIDDAVNRIPVNQFTSAQHHALVNWVDTMAQEAVEQRRLRTEMRTTLYMIAGSVIVSPVVVILANHFIGK